MSDERKCDPGDLLSHVIFILLPVNSSVQGQNVDDLERAFADLRFRIFLHFSIMAFKRAHWATPNQDIGEFSPADLNYYQWTVCVDRFTAATEFEIGTTKSE